MTDKTTTLNYEQLCLTIQNVVILCQAETPSTTPGYSSFAELTGRTSTYPNDF